MTTPAPTYPHIVKAVLMADGRWMAMVALSATEWTLIHRDTEAEANDEAAARLKGLK